MADQVIPSTSLLEPADCDQIFERVLSLREHWTPRQGGWMFTLGAASYLDDDGYDALACRTNPILWQAFADLYERLAAHLETTLGAPVGYDQSIALPGFHVFVCGPEMTGEQARAHRDTPHLRRTWDGPVSDPFSCTLPIRLPRGGGGLNVWTGLAPRYLAYELGRLYLIGPDLLHQIANRVEVSPGEFRVTLQAHGVRRADGRYVLFF